MIRPGIQELIADARGTRKINEAEVIVIRRIFRDYLAGKSSRAIAQDLNRERVPGPFGRAWEPSTIHGSVKRSNGILNKELYICSAALPLATREPDNRLNIRVKTLEASVLNGLQKHLMDPALFKEFCDEFTQTVNRLRMERSADLIAQRKELDRTQRDLDRAIQAILDGVPGAKLKDRIGALETRKAELQAVLAEATEPPPALLHPNMAETYRSRIEALQEALQEPACRAAAIDSADPGRPRRAGPGRWRAGDRAAG